MARGPIYRVRLRRRRQGKTNYYQRRELLKSGKNRLIIRKSTKNMRVQFIDAQPNGDITLSSSSSIELKDYSWSISNGNIPAAYVTGYLAGKKALNKGVNNAILDLGVQSNSSGSRIYAALKGVIDAGIDIPSNNKIFPDKEVLYGSHIKKIGENIQKEDSKDFKKRFAKYTKAKIKIGDVSKLVEKAISSIDKAF